MRASPRGIVKHRVEFLAGGLINDGRPSPRANDLAVFAKAVSREAVGLKMLKPRARGLSRISRSVGAVIGRPLVAVNPRAWKISRTVSRRAFSNNDHCCGVEDGLGFFVDNCYGVCFVSEHAPSTCFGPASTSTVFVRGSATGSTVNRLLLGDETENNDGKPRCWIARINVVTTVSFDGDVVLLG